MQSILDKLFELQDLQYQAFNAKLIPNIPQEKVIGVRTPMLRALAKEIKGQEETEQFLEELPHAYQEENVLHGCLIELVKDYEECVDKTEKFLPYVDNWAVCDMMSPKVFAKNKEKLIEKIRQWIQSEDTYTVRFAIEMLMSHYLDQDFKKEYADLVAEVRSEEYYVNMMIAWYFATALAKQYDTVITYLTEQRLPLWVHNKTIQKAVESRRITKEQKDFLRTLRMKKER